MPSSERRKPIGRPRGTGAKLERVRARIANGEDPLSAYQAEGYTQPYRSMKRHAVDIAVERAADPAQVLRDIAINGATADKIRACEGLLALVPDETPKRCNVLLRCVLNAREHVLPSPTRTPVYALPKDTRAALAAYDALADAPAPTLNKDGFSALRVLTEIVARASDKDSDLVRAAVLLIKRASDKLASDEPTYVFDLPDNDRMPKGSLDDHTIYVVAAPGRDPVEMFFDALKRRDVARSDSQTAGTTL